MFCCRYFADSGNESSTACQAACDVLFVDVKPTFFFQSTVLYVRQFVFSSRESFDTNSTFIYKCIRFSANAESFHTIGCIDMSYILNNVHVHSGRVTARRRTLGVPEKVSSQVGVHSFL